jgi:tryptophan synthase alpha chain
MSRIKELFERKPARVLNVYCTAGYPDLDSTIPVMKSLQESGADMIELGMPYSDPLADGPVIQASSSQALANGMSLPVLFGQLKGFRREIHLPVILMGYMNPVLQYGFEKFCADASEAGIDGIILPDLPGHEFVTQYAPLLEKYNLDFIFLVTPETSEERVKKLDALSSGFLYAVSASATTGTHQHNGFPSDYLIRLASYGLKNPVLVGFGIKDHEGFEAASSVAAGAIVGSAYIKALGKAGELETITREFVKGILQE